MFPFPFEPEHYAEQLAAKRQRLATLLEPFGTPPITVFASPSEGFRMRAEFRFWHEADGGHFVMFPKGEPNRPMVVTAFPIGHPRINTLMEGVRGAVNRNPLLLQKLYQVEFLVTLSGESLVTLIYHRALETEWESAARELQQQLGTSIIGRSRKQVILLNKNQVDEQLVVNGRTLHYRQMEGGFTQPNAFINQEMLGWAERVTASTGGDLLELYCGNGNFTMALARNFRQVLATEVGKGSVAAAQHNLLANGITNTRICRMSSEEISEAIAGKRIFRRLAEQGINPVDYRFSTLLVDPPRAGLDPATLGLAKDFGKILYISCNPDSLAANLATLAATHRIEAVALFDQFPYTHHMESGLLLSRRN